jgi:hypothetical protein
VKVIDVRARYQGGFKTPRKSTDYLIVHHAAAIYKDGPTALRVIEDWHVNHNGWSGIGYQEILAEETQGGEIVCYIISAPNLQRAHIGGQNDTMFGICAATNFDDVRYFPNKVPTEKWIAAIAERLRYHKRVNYPKAKIEGHKDKALPAWPSDCPGQKWYQWKPALLARVAAAEDLVVGGILVDAVFAEPYRRSGGIWEGVGILTPGVPLGPAFEWQGAKYQLFERSGLRYTEASGVEWMFQSEVETLNRERSS